MVLDWGLGVWWPRQNGIIPSKSKGFSFWCAAELFSPSSRRKSPSLYNLPFFARGSRLVGMLEGELEQWCSKGFSHVGLVQFGVRVTEDEGPVSNPPTGATWEFIQAANGAAYKCSLSGSWSVSTQWWCYWTESTQPLQLCSSFGTVFGLASPGPAAKLGFGSSRQGRSPSAS